MPRFFYSASNLQNHHAPDSWWRRWRRKNERRRALQKLDANLVQVRNPFRKEIKEESSFRWLGVAVVLVLFFGWLGTMLYLPYFRLNDVEFSGLNIIKENEIKDFVYNHFINTNQKWWPANNYFILNNNKVERYIKDNFAVEQVSVEKVFPSSLKISLVEKVFSIIYDNGRSYILLDENGNYVKLLKLIPEDEFINESVDTAVNSSTDFSTNTKARVVATTTETLSVKVHKPNFKLIQRDVGTFPLILDQRIDREDKNNLEKDVVVAVLAWQKLLDHAGVGELQYFVLDSLAAGLKIKTSESWDILVNIHGNHESAFNNLTSLIRDNNPSEYVDLRYGERVYWR